VAKSIGDADAALKGAAQEIDAEYEVPFLAHAPMEPLNCTVEFHPDKLASEGCDIYTGTQFQTPDQRAAAGILGIKPEQVSEVILGQILTAGTGQGAFCARNVV
jgi:isoquinoline 1-oxidoreductase beta subunit